MKIGIIIGSLGIGGSERVSTRLSEWWVTKGHEVSFYTTMQPPEKEYPISSSIRRFYCHQAPNKLMLIKNLRSSIKSDHPDIVLIMDTPMTVYAIPALCGLNIPSVLSERSDPNTNAIKKKTRYLSRILMKFCSGYVFQTNGAKSCYTFLKDKKCTIIPNPIIVKELPKRYIGTRQKKVVAMGRLIPAKNYPLLIRAFSDFYVSHPDYCLEIYGDGVEKEKVEQEIMDSSARQAISLKGAVNNVLEVVVDSGMFVLSSDLEGMPNALIEALAIGLPSISTNCPPGGPADLIEDGINGLLVETNNREQLARAMMSIADDSGLADKLSSNGVMIGSRLDVSIIGKQWIDFFETITKCY